MWASKVLRGLGVCQIPYFGFPDPILSEKCPCVHLRNVKCESTLCCLSETWNRSLFYLWALSVQKPPDRREAWGQAWEFLNSLTVPWAEHFTFYFIIFPLSSLDQTEISTPHRHNSPCVLYSSHHDQSLFHHQNIITDGLFIRNNPADGISSYITSTYQCLF